MIRARFLDLLMVIMIMALVSLVSSPHTAHAQATLMVGNGSGIPGLTNTSVGVSLENLNNKVRAVQVDVCDLNDYLTVSGIAGCAITERTSDFTCSTSELENGCVRVVLISFTGGLIEEGTGTVFTLMYDVSAGAPRDICFTLTPEEAKVSDGSGAPLAVSLDAGQFCLFVCGDIYPPESLPENPFCGDGVVNLLDILGMIDMLLGLQTSTACQELYGDIANGIPPFCGDPAGEPNCMSDGDIDIFDALVIIRKAVGKANCCDYCVFGE